VSFSWFKTFLQTNPFFGTLQDNNMQACLPFCEQIALLSADGPDAQAFCHTLETARYRTIVYSRVPDLDNGLRKNPCLAAILDADSIPLTNAAIRTLKENHPQVHFLLASRNPFHPELQEAISRILFACLKKPADADEILYLLRSMASAASPCDDRP
jgi:DNA-binding NtrC family response regulator